MLIDEAGWAESLLARHAEVNFVKLVQRAVQVLRQSRSADHVFDRSISHIRIFRLIGGAAHRASVCWKSVDAGLAEKCATLWTHLDLSFNHLIAYRAAAPEFRLLFIPSLKIATETESRCTTTTITAECLRTRGHGTRVCHFWPDRIAVLYHWLISSSCSNYRPIFRHDLEDEYYFRFWLFEFTIWNA